MLCGGCGNQAYRTQTHINSETNDAMEVCNVCDKLSPLWMPDIYLGGKGGIQTDDQLVEPGTNNSIPFTTKREKAMILKRLKLKQSVLAERNHGGRNEEYLHRKKYFFT